MVTSFSPSITDNIVQVTTMLVMVYGNYLFPTEHRHVSRGAWIHPSAFPALATNHLAVGAPLIFLLLDDVSAEGGYTSERILPH